MKKTICAFLAVMMLIGCACADDFVLRNGVQFGMTLDDISALEAKNGFTLEERAEIWDMAPHYTIMDVPSLAGFSAGGDIQYYFDDQGLLNVCVYNIFPDYSEAEAKSLIDALNRKYGEQVSPDSSPLILSDITVNALSLSAFDADFAKRSGVYSQYSANVKQGASWLVPLDNGGYVSILLIDLAVEEISKFGADKGIPRQTERLYLSYAYRSPADVEQMQEQQQQLLEQEQQLDDARNSDI